MLLPYISSQYTKTSVKQDFQNEKKPIDFPDWRSTIKILQNGFLLFECNTVHNIKMFSEW